MSDYERTARNLIEKAKQMGADADRVIAQQRIEALEAEIERLKNSEYWQQKGREMVGDE